MKSKSRKSDKKSNAIRSQGSTQHRLTSGVRTPSPPDATPPSTAAAIVAQDTSPAPEGHQSLPLTIRIGPKNPGGKSCELTGNIRLNKEGSEITGNEPAVSNLVFVGGSDAVPEVVEGQEIKHRFVGFDGSCNNHQAPPTKRMKMMNRETQPSSSSSSSSAERCNAGVLTDPDCLGPCDPGSSVILEGIVWNESRNGLLVVNVTWRGKTYVGTLMDSTNHNWASPSFKEDSLSSDNHSSSREEDGVIVIPEGRRLRRCRAAQPSGVVIATTSTASSSSTSTSSSSSKASNTRAKCRIQTGDNSAQPDSVSLHQTANGGVDPGVLCPELHCQRKFKHEAALRNHRFRAHKVNDSMATVSLAPSTGSSAVALTARSIADDSFGTLSAAQSRESSPLLPAKQRCFDGEDDVSSSFRVEFIKKSEGEARHCMEKDGESLEIDCPLIKPASDLESDKLDCFVPTRLLQSTPVIFGSSVHLSSAMSLASTEMEKGVAEAPLNSTRYTGSESAVPSCVSGEHVTVCADRQKFRSGSKKKCREKLDRMQKNSETVMSSSDLASQIFGQSLISVCAVAEHTTAGTVSLPTLEDKHSIKRLKTNSGIPVPVLSVSLNRIPMENDSSLALKTVSAAEIRSDERIQDAEKNGSSITRAVDSDVRGLGLDVAKLRVTSGFSSCCAGHEPSVAETSSQSLLAMREAMGRCHLEKSQGDISNYPPIKAETMGNMHAEKFAKPLSESCQALSVRGSSGSDSQSCNDHAVTPCLLVFRSSKTCHDKIVAPGNVCDEGQKLIALHSGSSSTFAADSSKSFLDHVGKESVTGSHLAYLENLKTDSTNSAKSQNSIFGARNLTGDGIGNQSVKQKCPAYQNLDQAIADRSAAISATPPGSTTVISSGPTPHYAKDILCDLNSFSSGQMDSPDPKGAVLSRSAVPFAVPPGSRSMPNGSLTWTTSSFVSSMPNLQHVTRSNASSEPQTIRPSTHSAALPSAQSTLSSSTPDCSFVPYCRAIQGAPATASLPKQTNKACAPSPSLASCPLEASTASEVFTRRDDRSWTNATVGKSAQHAITNLSCSERNLIKCGGVSLPVPIPPPPPPSQPPSTSSSSPPTNLYHGIASYQQKKEKLISTLHSSATKPQSSSSRSLLAGHSVQAACPK